METYESIKQWKDCNISSHIENNFSLNEFHDQVMLKVLEVAKGKMNHSPPCEFSWFITGSGGRLEQGLISDQDHGIIYENSSLENDSYFKALGEELCFGLDFVGYPYCKGQIMPSNSLWCKSFAQWEKQIMDWLEDESWEAIRYLQIFFDARVLHGNSSYVYDLKSIIFQYERNHSNLLIRFVANMKHARNVIGPMGQIIVEQHGIYQGHVNLNNAAFTPYVNSIRFLSLKEGIYESSTLERIARLNQLEEYKLLLHNSERNFQKLIHYRNMLIEALDYENSHYLKINNLSKEQRKEIKAILKDGKKIHEKVISSIIN
ncbi:CBS domain-containing protein OS=Ureibacillus acetophenoni OX=614649 GN=SAMN05877842_10261 PE=4 SV=1 [Ureibacillus acetophenoni]